MINGTIETWDIQQQQISDKGYFSVGTGSEVIFIMGSCRSVPYLNYLYLWNEQNGNRFTVCFADPFTFHWTKDGERVNYEEKLIELESNESLLAMLKSCKIFLHEYYENAGMFNVSKDKEKNIYQFGINPEITISIPAFNDIFILTADIVNFDTAIKYKATQDYNVFGKLSAQTLQDIAEVRERNLEKFYANCAKTSFPEFAAIFKENYKKMRFFWNSNHIAKKYTLHIFYILAGKFLKLSASSKFIEEISKHDMYANNYTYLTEYDEGYSWTIDGVPEEIKLLKEKL